MTGGHWVMRAVMVKSTDPMPNPLDPDTPAGHWDGDYFVAAEWMQPKFEYVREWVDE